MRESIEGEFRPKRRLLWVIGKRKGIEMLIDTISFEIHDFTNHISEQFLVLNTEENYERVLSHRYTRNIKLGKTFSFQFEKEMSIPAEFIEMETWLRLINSDPELFAGVAEFTSDQLMGRVTV
ncbi:MAG: hypothetical protein HMLIMOIP_002077 [Candidatus Nitrosomirales archaeon]|jgi:hypothetical protein